MARGRPLRKSNLLRTLYWRRSGAAVAALLLAIAVLATPTAAQDDAVKATVNGTVNDGYARLVVEMSEFDDANVRVANNIMIISFSRPVDIAVDRIAAPT